MGIEIIDIYDENKDDKSGGGVEIITPFDDAEDDNPCEKKEVPEVYPVPGLEEIDLNKVEDRMPPEVFIPPERIKEILDRKRN